ncbi:hypothetical protein BDZ97DRAFT_1411822 [Flammula alnicola]|nr:hypothetical protein BDZ97DRAFT_1411822 [Flammula alnicola]
MSTTDDALNWLCSLDSTCTSSPGLSSASPYLTDWLHITPATDSPTSSAPPSSSPPLQDVSSSSRVNWPQTQDFGFNHLYYVPDYFYSDAGTSSASLTGSGLLAQVPEADGIIPTSVQPAIFNQHNRMLSLESTTATLVNTPSPRPLTLFSPPGIGLTRNENDNRASFHSSLLYSPATKLMQELQSASFGNYYDLAATSLPTEAVLSDISPVVRADRLQEHFLSNDKPAPSKSKKKKRRNKHSKAQSSFVEKLQAVSSLPRHPSPVPASDPGDLELLSLPGTSLESALAIALPQTVLLSPCKLVSTLSPSVQLQQSLDDTTLPILPIHGTSSQELRESVGPICTLASIETLSPLTPLTPLTSSPEPLPRLKITLKLKRKAAEPSTPLRRSKRPRRDAIVESPPSPEASNPSASEASSPEPSPPESLRPVYATRTLPATIEISANFPLFYRRFPASSYYQPGDTDSPCTLFGAAHPGGLYNPPRSALDLYTPRFVKGKGVEKVGLCPVCLESPERGGENKKLWLAMKFSAFNYHMQYAHGISASTGRPFSPPTAFRIVPRPNPGKKEKHRIQQGKCDKCDKWVAVEGIKDMESKVKELHWYVPHRIFSRKVDQSQRMRRWKHAAACHQDSALKGEDDYYENDLVLSKLLALKTEDA